MLLLPDDSSGLLATLIPNARWRAKGLVAVFLGNKCVWNSGTGARPLAPTGGPKTVPSKFGLVTGFGSTSGGGTTDRLDGGFLPVPSSGWRSIVAHFFANSSGGGTFGRVFQNNSGPGNDSASGSEAMYAGYSGIAYNRNTQSGSIGQWVTQAITTGRWQSVGFTHDQRTNANAPDIYMDGVVSSLSSSLSPGGDYVTTGTSTVFGNRVSDSARCWEGLLGPILCFDGLLDATDHANLNQRPLQVFDPDYFVIWLPFDAAGAQILNPGSGHLTASGKQPTVSQTANQAVAPGAGHLTASGKQPTVTRTDNQAVAPGVGHLTASGKQPTVTRTDNQAVAPGVGHLTASGKQPTVSQSSGTLVQPGAGHLTASGKQPTVTRTDNQAVAPGAGHLTASGKQPTVTRTDNQAVAPGAGHLTASGKQPSVSQSGQIVISPATWHLIFTGHQPTVSQWSGALKPWDDLAVFYDTGPYGFASSVLLEQTTFAGILDLIDVNAWDHAAITTHQLRYRSEQPLGDGDQVTIEARIYRVVGTPQRLSRSEKRAHLVRVA